MTNNMWLLILFISEFITGCVAYSVGRSNRNNVRKPKAITCDLNFFSQEHNGYRICQRTWHTCKSGYCNKHCKDYECNCIFITNEITSTEKEILEEVKQITRG